VYSLSDHQIKCDVFQREMMAATEKLYPLLSKFKGGASWCNDVGLFPSGTEGCHGVLNLSPAWFQQGHEVSCISMVDLSSAADIQWRQCSSALRLAQFLKSQLPWNG
jgi:hypothetical protein